MAVSAGADQTFKLLGKIKQSPKRHIGIPCTLVFIEIDAVPDDKRQIVLPLHKNDILHGDHFQFLRICVCTAFSSYVLPYIFLHYNTFSNVITAKY